LVLSKVFTGIGGLADNFVGNLSVKNPLTDHSVLVLQRGSIFNEIVEDLYYFWRLEDVSETPLESWRKRVEGGKVEQITMALKTNLNQRD